MGGCQHLQHSGWDIHTCLYEVPQGSKRQGLDTRPDARCQSTYATEFWCRTLRSQRIPFQIWLSTLLGKYLCRGERMECILFHSTPLWFITLIFNVKRYIHFYSCSGPKDILTGPVIISPLLMMVRAHHTIWIIWDGSWVELDKQRPEGWTVKTWWKLKPRFRMPIEPSWDKGRLNRQNSTTQSRCRMPAWAPLH